MHIKMSSDENVMFMSLVKLFLINVFMVLFDIFYIHRIFSKNPPGGCLWSLAENFLVKSLRQFLIWFPTAPVES